MSKNELPEDIEIQIEDFVNDGTQYGEYDVTFKTVAEKMYSIMSERQKLKPIESAPYDTQVLLRQNDGNFYQGFIYDGQAPENVTHWMPLPELLEEEL